MKTYYILDNGDRPFKVNIDKNNIDIYKKKNSLDNNKILYNKNPILTFKNVNKIFIGKSPKNKMTVYSGGYGKEYNGNTILLNIKDNNYVCISSSIFLFQSLSEIIKYVSHVGNSGVPYPYAVDKNNMNYLMLDNVIIKNVPNNINPYQYYYKNSNNFENISNFIIGEESYDLNYTPFPEKNYARISKFNDFGSGMKIIYKNGKTQKIGNKEYTKILKEYGKKKGFYPLKYKVLHKSLN